MEKLARQIARKTRRDRLFDAVQEKFCPNEMESPFADKKSRGRAVDVTKATSFYAFELWLALIHVPGAFLYNLANGCHNMPSYGAWSIDVRRRDEITGLGSGLRTAGKEFVLGHWDAWTGLALHPYKGAKQEGLKGFGKGVYRAGRGFTTNILAGTLGLGGYSLKGVEKEFAKRRLTRLQAELLLIRLRQSIEEYKEAPEDERMEAIKRWKELYPA